MKTPMTFEAAPKKINLRLTEKVYSRAQGYNCILHCPIATAMRDRYGANLESVGGDHVRMKDANANEYFYHIDHPVGTLPSVLDAKTPTVVKLSKTREKIWR
jgi:hypothetical protein